MEEQEAPRSAGQQELDMRCGKIHEAMQEVPVYIERFVTSIEAMFATGASKAQIMGEIDKMSQAARQLGDGMQRLIDRALEEARKLPDPMVDPRVISGA